MTSLEGCGKTHPFGIRSPDRLGCSESLYRLSYRGSQTVSTTGNYYSVTSGKKEQQKWNKIGVLQYSQNVVTYVHFTTTNVIRCFNFAEKGDVDISQQWNRKLIVLKRVGNFSGVNGHGLFKTTERGSLYKRKK